MDRVENNNNTEAQTFAFSGSGGEYFRIWIVNLTLTILTLGIFSAWAKVRRLKYFYGHTRLDGHGFDYLANPKRILLGRVIAVLLLIAYTQSTRYLPDYAFYIVCGFVLLIPFILVTSTAFTMRNTSYRNIRFHFRAEYGAAYRAILLPVAVVLLVVGGIYGVLPDEIGNPERGRPLSRVEFLPQLLILAMLPFIPWFDYIRSKFVITRTQYGTVHGDFSGTPGDFYGLYAKFFFSALGAGILVAFIGGVFAAVFRAGAGAEPVDRASFNTVALLFVAIVYLLLFVLFAWFSAQRNNLLRNHTRFGDHRLQGDFAGWDMAKLLIGNVFAILLTLGLFTPWASVRLARYNADHTRMNVDGLNAVTAQAGSEGSAIGEEIGDFFDIDIGL